MPSKIRVEKIKIKSRICKKLKQRKIIKLIRRKKITFKKGVEGPQFTCSNSIDFRQIIRKKVKLMSIMFSIN